MDESRPDSLDAASRDASLDSRRGDLLAGYLDRLNRGEKLDRDRLLAEQPELGEGLFEDLQAFIGLAQDAAGDESLGTLGDYTLRRQIGRGGMGVVYEAWQASMDRRVALKVLPAGVAADTRAVARFIQEAQLAGKLSHPSIVHVHGMGVEQQVPYFAMDFVDGETLAQILARVKDAEPETETPFGKQDSVVYFGRLAEAFADVADGLQHAHARKVIHRDIKPSNLILDRDGRLRILDFGLARHEGQESLTRSGDVLGTPQYMSPEQARRRKVPVDHRTDVYSLGATLYEMLTLRPPFRGKDCHDTLSQIIERDPVAPKRLNSSVPRELETIVMKCLRKEAGDRYGTAEALGQDLRRFVRGDAIEARPPTRWQRTLRRLRRDRVRLLAVLMAALLAASAGWLEIARRRQERAMVLAAYEPAVRDAVLKIFAGRLSLEAAGGESRGLSMFRAQSLVMGEDFKTVLDLGGAAAVEQAAAQLEAQAAAVPDKADAYFHLGRAHSLLGRKGEAREAVARGLACDPGFVPAAALEVELSDRNDDEKRSALEALASEHERGGDWRGWWLLAQKGAQRKKWSDAARAWGELIRCRAQGNEPYIGFSVDAYMAQGLAFLETKDFVRAQEAFIAARALSPGAVEPELFLAKAYHVARKPDLAAATFKRLHAEASPRGRSEIALWITAAYNSLLDFDRALEWSQGLDDEAIKTRLKVYFLLRLGRTGGAIELGRKTIAGDSRDPVAHYVFGLALLDNLMSRPGTDAGELAEVLQVLRRALELKESYPACRELLNAVEGERKRIMEGPRKTLAAVCALAAAMGAPTQAQMGYFEPARKAEGINSALTEEGPVFSSDRLALFFARYGQSGIDAWIATRSRTDVPFGDPRPLEEINTQYDEGVTGISADGSSLYFTSNRPGGRGSWDIWLAERSAAGQPFRVVRNCEELNTEGVDDFATLTADGLEIYFMREAPGTSGDVYVARRPDTDQPFGEPSPVVELNTPGWDTNPFITPDGLTLFLCGFQSERPDGFGGNDMWMATRPKRVNASGGRVAFGTPVNLGSTVNTGFHDYGPVVTADWPASGASLYFSRNLGAGSDIFRAVWHPDCNQNAIDDLDDIAAGTASDENADGLPDECGLTFLRGDCNDDGTVDISDAVCILTWLFLGGATPGCVAATDTNGDAGSDISDATFVLNHLFLGGPAPAAPYPACGPGTLPADEETCAAPPARCQ